MKYELGLTPLAAADIAAGNFNTPAVQSSRTLGLGFGEDPMDIIEGYTADFVDFSLNEDMPEFCYLAKCLDKAPYKLEPAGYLTSTWLANSFSIEEADWTPLRAIAAESSTGEYTHPMGREFQKLLHYTATDCAGDHWEGRHRVDAVLHQVALLAHDAANIAKWRVLRPRPVEVIGAIRRGSILIDEELRQDPNVKWVLENWAPAINTPLCPSWPSASATRASAMATAVEMLGTYQNTYRRLDQVKQAHGMARVAAGVSWPSDVKDGWALGEQVADRYISPSMVDEG